ncbi:23S rRNA (uracil(1939)-C(5))-methyltransferase RlmD [Pontibacter sp. BT310]|uniref:23S rRNA (Uracil(1939)-C(5))-methyltransferase RlmD n=1 Tax=Pontibacter populi TaxID=890055 RepID=A0ABS6X6U3_9BACT|nr:23S rRNA (uracil(1939)-C(5))-methyltransferase RlmD [Pontibacter populi]MBJ6116742.1 23S rRNA (uracil(1939)-C(5))-methyltransferase RlmD [Pontibacter sp. BT310]MBW3363596.1 23S rRNA (uracil(1939)-C(5))-methyltransferase RlmD [Pontibacter populi]
MVRNKKQKTFEILENIRIEEMVAEGKCLARHNNMVIFVGGVAPGDVVDLRITKKKKSFMEAVPVQFREYSDLRVQPFCEHFGICGGCKWQHIGYDTQLYYKEKQVKDNLERIGKVVLPKFDPILGSKQDKFYRNKLEFTFSSFGWLTNEQIKSGENYNRNALGFHMPGRFDKILDIQHCYLQPDPSNAVRLAVRDYTRAKGYEYYDAVKQTGFLRNLIVRTANTGDLMVILLVKHNDEEAIFGILDDLYAKFPEITSLQYVVNPKMNDTFHDQEVICYKGQPYIYEQMEDIRFQVGPKSFYQTNADQAYELYRLTREFAGLTGNELVYDLYTGAGTIANFVARQAREVIGIEYVPSAIEDAKINSELNNITNTTFYAGDMKDILSDELIAQHGRPEVVITDPPRAGMHPDVIEKLLQVHADRIVYVSCNPATQARDLELLSEKYDVTRVQPVDMFPQTHHVENIVLLTAK